MFEPFHAPLSGLAREVGFRWGTYLPVDADAPDLTEAVDRVVTGRVRDAWIDRKNLRRHYRHRLVKDVATTNLVPWLCRQRPHDQFVYLVRHPLAVAWSLRDLNWRERAATTELFDQPLLRDGPLAEVSGLDTLVQRADSDEQHRLVLKWCFENFAPLATPPSEGCHIVLYEHLVTDPERELKRIGALTGDDHLLADPTRPSSADFHERAAELHAQRDQLISGWTSSITPAEVATSLDIVSAFGLDRLYDADPWPKVEPGEA